MKKVVSSLALIASLSIVVGCTSTETNKTSRSTDAPRPAVEPSITFSKKAVRSTDLTTGDELVVRVKDGTLKKVEDKTRPVGPHDRLRFVTVGKGKYRLKGVLDPTKNRHLVRVTVTDADGKFKRQTFSVKSSPEYLASSTLYPYEGTYGVGMPITVNFSAKVDKAQRNRVESLMTIRSYPRTEGSWGWLDEGKRAVWRPKNFWKPNTTVVVKLGATGVQIAEPGIVVESGVNGEFKIGRDFRVVVDDRTKTANAVMNGRTTRVMPVSLGKPGHLTSSGTHIVYEKGNPVRMRGEDYDQMVNWAQRYNTTGEYLHSAPWSVGSQGRSNVSHGCVNMSPVDAQWLYGQTMYGDPVVIKNTGRQADSWDGMGGVWNIDWNEWKKM